MPKRQLIVVALLLAGTFGCSPAAAPSADTALPPIPGDTEQASGPGKLKSCGVGLPADWTTKLEAAQQRRADAESVTIVASSADATRSFGKVVRGGKTRLVMFDQGRQHEILALDKGQDVFGFDFDGRWLSFGRGYDPAQQNEWAAFAWDSESTQAPLLIGDNRKGSPGPWFFSVVHQGKVSWVQGVGRNNDRASVHLYDLATRKDKVVAEGPVNSPVFFGDLLVWRHVDQTTKKGRFHAVSAKDGTPARLPGVLREAFADQHVAADQHTIVWTADLLRTLYVWRTGWPAARKLVDIDAGPSLPGIQFPKISGDLVSWVSSTSFVTDIRTGSTFNSTKPGFWIEVNGGALTVSLSAAKTPI